MAIYAIGDIQGRFDALQALLEKIRFDPTKDQVWFTGDLVNRGEESLAVLRYVKSLGDAAISVLGNHDLHMLAVVEGVTHQRKLDTLDDILNAPDRDELTQWLRFRPVMHHSAEHQMTLVHAGLPPQWDLAMAQQCAKELEDTLQSNEYKNFLHHMYGNEPDKWVDALNGIDRLRFITNAFTRMRYCYEDDGRIDMKHKMAPGKQPEGLVPWYRAPERKNADLDIIFGHWSTHGDEIIPGIHALDTGCLWGGCLTALRVDGEHYLKQVSCSEGLAPSK